MDRSAYQRFARVFEGLFAWLSIRALRESSAVQAWMGIDELDQWFPKQFFDCSRGILTSGTAVEHLGVFLYGQALADMPVWLQRETLMSQIPRAIAEHGMHYGWSAQSRHYYCHESPLKIIDTSTAFSTNGLSGEIVPVGYYQPEVLDDTSLDLVSMNSTW